MRKTEQKCHIRPDSMPPEDWERLTPIEKARLTRNPRAPIIGTAIKKETMQGPRKPKAPIGRPRKDGSPPIQRMAVSTITPTPVPAIHQDGQVAEPSFKVTEADSIKDAIETNGLALLNDAYAKAARASMSGDPLDRAIYLTLLGKAHPMAQIGHDKALSGHAKAQMRQLTKLLADQEVQDGEFRTVESGAGGDV